MDRTLWPAIGLLFAIFVLFDLTSLDLIVQDAFFNFKTDTWLVNAKVFLPKLIFHTGLKAVVIATAVAFLVLALGPETWRCRVAPQWRRRDIWIILLTLASGPGLITTVKATSNVFCPYEIRRYGGKVPYVHVLGHYPPGDKPARRG